VAGSTQTNPQPGPSGASGTTTGPTFQLGPSDNAPIPSGGGTAKPGKSDGLTLSSGALAKKGAANGPAAAVVAAAFIALTLVVGGTSLVVRRLVATPTGDQPT
jgi:hypothetical protein